MIKPSSLMRIGAVVIVLTIHVLVGFFSMQYKWVEYPSYWKTQFLYLMIISAVIAIIIYSRPANWVVLPGFILRTAIALIIITSMPEQIPIYSLLLVVLVFELFVMASRLIGIITGATLILVMTLQRYATNQTWGYPHQVPGLADFVIPWGEFSIAMILGVLLRTLLDRTTTFFSQAEQLRKSNMRLLEANLGLQDYTIRAQRESIINERNRISREIHDSVGYILTNLIAVLDFTRELILVEKRELALEKIDSAREQARSALEDVRRAVRALRPPVEVSHLQAVSILIAAFSDATGVDVSFRTSDLPEHLGGDSEWLIYRVIQEALTNTFRHGEASQVFINLRCKNKYIRLDIQDNGLGTNHIKLGCGLTGIQERVESLGGKLEVESALGRGFTIKILLPWTAETGADKQDQER